MWDSGFEPLTSWSRVQVLYQLNYVEVFDWGKNVNDILTPIQNHKINVIAAGQLITVADAIEAIHNIRYCRSMNQTLFHVAPQHIIVGFLIECSQLRPYKPKFDMKECYLLSIEKAFQRVIYNEGITREKDYSFRVKRGVCQQMKKIRMKIESIQQQRIAALL